MVVNEEWLCATHFMSSFKFLLYLFERMTQWDTHTHTFRDNNSLVLTQAETRSLKVHLHVPHELVGIPKGSLSIFSPGTVAGIWTGNGAAGARTGDLIQDAGVTGSG